MVVCLAAPIFMSPDNTATSSADTLSHGLKTTLGDVLEVFREASMDLVRFDRRRINKATADLGAIDQNVPFWAEAMLEMVSVAIQGRPAEVRSRFVVLKGFLHDDWLIEFVCRYGLALMEQVEREQILPVVNLFHGALFHGLDGPYLIPISTITRELEAIKNSTNLDKSILFWAFAILHMVNRVIAENRLLELEDLYAAMNQLPVVEALQHFLTEFVEKKQRLAIRPTLNLLRAAAYDVADVDEEWLNRAVSKLPDVRPHELKEYPHLAYASVIIDLVRAARAGDLKAIIRKERAIDKLPDLPWLRDFIEVFVPALLDQADQRRLELEQDQLGKLVVETKALLLMAGINPTRVQPIFINRLYSSFRGLSYQRGAMGLIQDLAVFTLDFLSAVQRKSIPEVLSGHAVLDVCLNSVRAIPKGQLPQNLITNVTRFSEIAQNLTAPFLERAASYTGLNAMASIEQQHAALPAGGNAAPVLLVLPRGLEKQGVRLRDLTAAVFSLFNRAALNIDEVDDQEIKAMDRRLKEDSAGRDLAWAEAMVAMVMGARKGVMPEHDGMKTMYDFLLRAQNRGLLAAYRNFFVPWLFAQAALRRSRA